MPGFSLIVPSVSVPVVTTTPTAFPTAFDFWSALADQIGSYLSTTTSSTIPSGEPGRWVILEELGDDEDLRDALSGGWVYVRTGDQAGAQRRIRNTGYEGPLSAVALSRVLSVGTPPVPTNLASSVSVAVTIPLPVRRDGTTKGLLEITNEGLARMWTTAYLALAGNGTSLYSLSAYPFIVSDSDIDGVYDRLWGVPTTEPPVRSPLAATIKADGGSVSLVTGTSYAAGTTFYLKVFVRANRLIYDAPTQTWGYTTDGLVNDDDQAAVPLAWWLPIAMVKGLQYLRRLTRRDKTLTKEEKIERLGEIKEQMDVYAPAAADIILRSLPRPTPPPAQGMTEISQVSLPAGTLTGGTGWP